MAAEIQARLQGLSDDFTKLQQDLQTAVGARQKLEAQKQENLGVQKEFAKLKDDETIYKLIGPVLLKQDRTEAESTVNGRLEFINNEISRQEDQIKETQGKIEKKKAEIIQVQTAAQAAAGGGQAARA
ncbi:Prefoldin [Podospora aff. communis PSN243]|uniref:Prefoldin n=1 Tax=Podospora aff. communis PSN243 TaxID=3040156 RepID=A0AAV9GVV2_9PEZI|nr:Prefoldin [Podospora aff. communis PSN243]